MWRPLQDTPLLDGETHAVYAMTGNDQVMNIAIWVIKPAGTIEVDGVTKKTYTIRIVQPEKPAEAPNELPAAQNQLTEKTEQ